LSRVSPAGITSFKHFSISAFGAAGGAGCLTGVRVFIAIEALEERSGIPYDNLSDLPDSVRNNLPKHAQEIYRAAYNSAEEQYGEEERAHRVAWSAVENKYEKNDQGNWVEKKD
jgi:cation transport regulator